MLASEAATGELYPAGNQQMLCRHVRPGGFREDASRPAAIIMELPARHCLVFSIAAINVPYIRALEEGR